MGLVLRVEQASAAFGEHGTMNTVAVKIHLKEGAVPYAVHIQCAKCHYRYDLKSRMSFKGWRSMG